MTPFDRGDTCALASRLDDGVDHVEAAADLVVLYEPDGVPPDLLARAEVPGSRR